METDIEAVVVKGSGECTMVNMSERRREKDDTHTTPPTSMYIYVHICKYVVIIIHIHARLLF